MQFYLEFLDSVPTLIRSKTPMGVRTLLQTFGVCFHSCFLLFSLSGITSLAPASCSGSGSYTFPALKVLCFSGFVLFCFCFTTQLYILSICFYILFNILLFVMGEDSLQLTSKSLWSHRRLFFHLLISTYKTMKKLNHDLKKIITVKIIQ